MRRRRLWCVILISGLGAFIVFVAAKPANTPQWEHVNRTCRARDCNDLINYGQLRTIESHMNTTADPCKSFYGYACGNWHKQHSNRSTMMMKASYQLTSELQNIFEAWHESIELQGVNELNAKRLQREHAENETLSASFKSSNVWHPHNDLILQKMLKYYRVCKAQQEIGAPSLRAYYEYSKSIINWQLNDYDWIETLAGMARFGYSAHFLTMNVVQKNISVHRVVICPHELESTLEITPEIYEILHDITNQTKAELQQRFNELERDLEKLNCQYCKQICRNETEECDCYRCDPIKFKNFTSEIPEFDWQRYLLPQLGRQLNDDDILEVANLDLIKLQLAYVRSMDKELNLLYTLTRFLNYIQEQRFQLAKHDTPELNCIHHMRKVFNLPMNYLYERAAYSTKRKQSERIIEEVFDELKIQFERMIIQNKMEFSRHIQEKLLSKLKRITINVGNLPKNVSLQFYYDYIADYKFDDEFLHNHMHALIVFYRNYYLLLDQSEDELQHIWHSFDLHQPYYPDTLDASPYYSARTNLIVITYSYLQLPFFDASFWPALIYGDLASTLGHELIHAFDTEFIKFDENGNPTVEPLRSIFLNHNFQRNFACLKRGTVFERERMADVSGARLALNTFLNLDANALVRNGVLYFLQFSQFFCGEVSPEDTNHDIDSLRLDYVLAALPEFSKVFNCPLGSPMNPYEKCEMYA